MIVTFDGPAPQLTPKVTPQTPIPTPEMRPDPDASHSVLRAGGQLNVVSGAYSRSYSYDTLGNILTLAGNSYTYGSSRPHAVTQVGSDTYGYDANGNMIGRTESGTSYTQTFDDENRLTQVAISGSGTSDFLYDASGQRMKTVEKDSGGNVLRTVYTPFPTYEEEIQAASMAATIIAPETVEAEIYRIAANSTIDWRYLDTNCTHGDHLATALPELDDSYAFYGFLVTSQTDATLHVAAASVADGWAAVQMGDATAYVRAVDGSDPVYAVTLVVTEFSRATEALLSTTFPQAQESQTPIVHGSTVTRQRLTYTFNGQLVAVRVWESGSNTLSYIHNDHLGSSSLLTDSSGAIVAGSITKYYPFGSYRQQPTTNPSVTDRGFTGHRHNDNLRLIYANARYYLPGIGRFASADTFVPRPTDPQSFNRYSYTSNRPLAFVDLDGHGELCEGGPIVCAINSIISKVKHALASIFGQSTSAAPQQQSQPIWTRSPVATPSSIQLYGNTQYAYENGATHNYDDFAQGLHPGIDMLAPAGTTIISGTIGTVSCVSSPERGCGGYEPGRIHIQYGNMTLLYGHVEDIQVEVGDTVSPDTMLGRIGSYEGAHLHLEIIMNDANGSYMVNPLPYLAPDLQESLLAIAYDQNDSRVQFYRPTPTSTQWTTPYDQPILRREAGSIFPTE